MIDFAPDEDSKLSLEQLRNHHTSSWWQRKSIRFKTTLLAIAIGIIPTLAVGSIGYYYAANSIEREIINLRETLVGNLQTQVSAFMGDRLNDIEMMAQLSIFTNPELRASTTAESKSAALQKIQDAYGVYSSIAVFDAQGDLVAQTKGKVMGNHFNRGYIQAAIKADGAIVSPPRISTSGVYSIYTASVIKDSRSGETVGFVRARMPVKVLQELLFPPTKGGDRYYLINGGEIFLGSERYTVKTLNNESAARQTYDYEAIDFSKIFEDTEILNSSGLATDIAFNTQTNTEEFLTFAPLQTRAIPSLNWQAVIATDTAEVFAPRRKLRWVFIIGVGAIALGVGAIAYVLTYRLLHPILLAARAVQKIGRGDFDTRLKIRGTDEFARLGSDINRMAGQLSDFVETQTLLGQHSESLRNIALELSTTTEQLEIIELAITQSALVLNTNRIIYYQFETESSGKVVAEFVAPGFGTVKGQEIFSSDLVYEYHAEYQSNTEGKISDAIILANLDSVEPELFSQVNASLIAPVFIKDCLDGLLISANYTTRDSWLNAEMEFVAQVAKQIGFAATRLKFQKQQKLAEIREKSAKEILQQRALNLLQEVYDVSQGDLTIRARVSEDEIGTIADSYNSTIESLQKLVNQTKSAAIEVQSNTVANDLAIQSLAQETVAQAAEIVQMRSRLAEMEQSIDLVANQASQARDFIEQAGSTIERTDRNMNQTVAEIDAVQDTVIQTTAKAQKLGESSQAISQAVNLIGRFAARTHLLALKASIEAARAGEKGRGFGVIAEEVRSLATQSAEATADIETLVNKIQLETSEVVQAMNHGRGQISLGSELVQQTRQSLTEVNQKSEQINQLVDSIAKAAKEQSSTSVRVSEAMNKVAAIASSNSHSATKVSASIKQLTAIAQKLQTNIDKFKT